MASSNLQNIYYITICAAVLLTDNNQFPPWTQAMTALIILGILLLTYLTLLASGKIYKVIGKNGSSIIIRVMGLLLTALAVQEITKGLIYAGIHFKG